MGIMQMILVKISYYICRFFNLKKQNGWVVVAVETASMLKNISSALPNSVSVNFAPNRFYDFNYNYEVYPKKGPSKLITLVYSSILFGYLLSKYDKFMYLGAIGFVNPYIDGRQQEFKFLKSINKQLVCYFLGSEIRSFKLLNQFSQERCLDVLTTYQAISHVGIDTSENEYKRKQLGRVADKYSDVIFNPSTDQMAYIQRKTFPFIYFLADKLFKPSVSKFDDLSEIIVLHGPSSPIIKGTPVVRAAIKKLQVEGYKFKYIELINVPHEQMLKTLRSAHIVLNEFYAFVPGVFGLEAMASSCVLLTSADEDIETTLDEGANNAWKVTPYWSVYDNLKLFLDNPEMIKPQAIAGYNWAKKHCTYAAGVKKMNDIIND
tara:strand:+ start:11481 stop:12611 length:1131 start_codon:yes stop_codon:yes gene_type:complete